MTTGVGGIALAQTRGRYDQRVQRTRIWERESVLKIRVALLAATGALALPSPALAAANYHIVKPSISTVAHIRKDTAYSLSRHKSTTHFTFRRVRVLKLGRRLSNGTTMFFAGITRPTHVHPQVIMVYGTGGYYIGRSPNTFGWALSDYGTHVPYSKVVPFGRSKIRVFTTPGLSKAGFRALTSAVEG